MKKRILSLLLAVITIIQIMPWSVLTVIAEGGEDETTGIDIADMEVGKLYRAKFMSDIFVPYARYPFIDSGILDRSQMPRELTVTRKSADDYDLVYVTENTANWPSEYTDYRYVTANKLSIAGGISVDSMEIGQIYTASWNTTDTGVYLYKKIPASESDIFVEYGYNSDQYVDPVVSTDGCPTELIVCLEKENDPYVRVTNEDWPTEYAQYRYLDPEYDVVILGEYVPAPDDGLIRGEVGLTIDGKTVTSLSIAEGEKTYVFTELSDKLDGDPTYRWELLIDRESNRWADIQDYVYPYAPISQALIANAGQENGAATLRCIAALDGKNYVSGELDISVDPSLPEPDLPLIPTVQSGSLTPLGAGNGVAPVAEGEDAFQITVNYVYARLNEDGIHENAHPPYTVSLGQGETFSGNVDSPFIIGYTACALIEDGTGSISFDGKTYNEQPTWVFTDVGVEDTEEQKITIYYVPQKTNFIVEHYYQNLKDDGYSLAGMDSIKTKYADEAVGENLARDVYGYTPLFYDATTTVSGNGNTVIEIYYDRVYYLVDFELAGGYGLMPYYVRYDTQVMLTTPTKPGYSFVNPWQLDRVYTVDEDTKIETNLNMDDTDISAAYKNKNANETITVQHNLEYTANWKEEEATFAIVYWKENANDNSYSCWGVQTVTGHSPGDVVTVDGTNIPEEIHKGEKNYFTYNPVLSDTQVTVKGDGSAVANVYYYRNIYTLTFTAKELCNIPEGHTHTDACYDYICNSNNHVHDENCTLICTTEEHKHDPVGCNCTVMEHTHTGDCCTIDEHTHVANCCSIEEHTHDFWCGNWMGNCSKNEHTHGAGNCDYTCGKAEHTHGNGNCNYTCGETAHKHGDGKCNYTCGKTAHTHGASCYNCGEDLHEHIDACKRLICAIPQNHTHNSACNSTNSSSTVAMITGKYGSDIRSKFPIKGRNDDSFAGYWWLVPNGSIFLAGGKNIVSLDQIPGENLTFTGSYKGTNAEIFYYTEVLPGESYVEGLPGSGDRKYALYKEVITVRSGHLTEKEEFHAIEGFTTGYASGLYYPNNIFNSTVAAENYLYYTRNSKKLQFYSNNVHLSDLDETVLYGASMSSYASVVPSYPAAFEKNAYEFAGWYTTPGCYDGTEYDFDTETMPDQDVLLYAKWVPTFHNVKVYRQESEIDSTESGKLLLDKTVEFGTQIQEDELAEYTKPNENYIFGGWYYVDENGEENRYDFNTMVVKHAYVIYAKWIKNVPIPYTVKYVTMVDGQKVEIAPQESGVALEGVMKTFTAKAGADLDEGYREWYFPHDRYITFTMSANEEQNVAEFVYETATEVKYTISHVFKDEKFRTYFGTDTFTYNTEFTITKGSQQKFEAFIQEKFNDLVNENNIKTEAKKQNDSLSSSNQTEVWNIVKSLTPDYYQQELHLVIDSSDNVMTFNWADAGHTTMYQVIHYVQNKDLNSYSVFSTEGYIVPDEPGKEYSAKWLNNMYGYDQNAAKSKINGNLPTGTGFDGLILELYYDRTHYTYTVHHYLVGTTQKLADDVVYDDTNGHPKAYFEQEISVASVAQTISGYVLYNGDVTRTIGTDNYEITCYYSPLKVNFRYQEAIPGRGTLSRTTDYIGEVGVLPDAKEASCIATPKAGYVFMGWFMDQAGTQSIPATIATVDGMTVTPLTPTSEMANQTVIFYALFVPTTLTITNSISAGTAIPEWVTENQGFIYKIEGKTGTATEGISLTVAVPVGKTQTVLGLPLGEYNIKLEGDWSWRYKELTCNIGTISEDKQNMSFTFNGGENVSFTYNAPGNDTNNGYYITDGAYNDPTPKSEP